MHMASAAYGIGKAAKDRMAQDFNKELDGTGWDRLFDLGTAISQTRLAD